MANTSHQRVNGLHRPRSREAPRSIAKLCHSVLIHRFAARGTSAAQAHTELETLVCAWAIPRSLLSSVVKQQIQQLPAAPSEARATTAKITNGYAGGGWSLPWRSKEKSGLRSSVETSD